MAGTGNSEGNGNGERLTGLQAAFVEHWITTRYNGTRAAGLAGYAGDDNTLANMASHNLRIPKIQRAIAEKLSGHGGSADEVIRELLDIARHSDVTRFMAPAGQLDYDGAKANGRYIQSVQKTKDGWRIQCYSRLDAYKELARILKAGGLEEKGAEWSGDVNVYFKGEKVEP